jgi:hypothetical protein
MDHALPSFCEVSRATRIPLASAMMDVEWVVPSADLVSVDLIVDQQYDGDERYSSLTMIT